MTIGGRIRAARKKAGLTQKELADKLGVTSATVSAFENDKTNIKQSTLLKICNALSISLWELKTIDFKLSAKESEDIASEMLMLMDDLSTVFFDALVEGYEVDGERYIMDIFDSLFDVAIKKNLCTSTSSEVFFQSLKLNKEGQKKILGYTNDLIDSGKYTKDSGK